MPRCRERGLNRFEFLSKGWNQPAGRQRIKEDTERDGFWLQTFKSERWGQFNGPALRMNACWDLRPSPPLPWQSSSSSLSALWAGLRMNSRWEDWREQGTIKEGLVGNKAHSLSWRRFTWKSPSFPKSTELLSFIYGFDLMDGAFLQIECCDKCSQIDIGHTTYKNGCQDIRH